MTLNTLYEDIYLLVFWLEYGGSEKFQPDTDLCIAVAGLVSICIGDTQMLTPSVQNVALDANVKHY